MSATFLIIPDTRQGHGTGHIVRAARLAAEHGARAALVVDFPWNARCHAPSTVEEIAGTYGTVHACRWEALRLDSVSEADLAGREREFVGIDAQNITRSEHAYARRIAPTIGIDLGGSARRLVTYLIDTLPNLDAHAPNIFELGLNDLPVGDRREHTSYTGRVLVAPGGEDSRKLAEKCVAALEHTGRVSPGTVDVAIGPLAEGFDLGAYACGGAILRNRKLKTILAHYPIVITTFGLTAYEALAAGCTVLSVAPTRYHARLSKKAGLPLIGGSAGVSRIRLARMLSTASSIAAEQERIRPVSTASIAKTLDTLEPSGAGACPLSGRLDLPAVHRMRSRTYRNSVTPAIDYMERFTSDTISYDENYFFEAYERQYGRSYLEDFEHIKEMCRARLRRIERIGRRAHPRSAAGDYRPMLVDLGCAYGPMLAAAAEHGYRVLGSDYFEGAVAHVRNQLGYPAVAGDITDSSLPEMLEVVGQADVVSMWYVIEHVRDLRTLLQNVKRMLKPGGVFAFSTPNGSGGSARFDRASFFERSPEDHWTIWNARKTRGFLREWGFANVHIHVTGHHPERFAPTLCRSRLGYQVARSYSMVAGLGDTFEAYAALSQRTHRSGS